jgi:hypothetical protein
MGVLAHGPSIKAPYPSSPKIAGAPGMKKELVTPGRNPGRRFFGIDAGGSPSPEKRESMINDPLNLL